MSMDFRKSTYRPKRQDTRFRTHYAQMSQWMVHLGNRAKRQQQQQRGEGPLSAVYGKKLPGQGASNPYTDNAGTGPRDFSKAAAIEENVPPHLRFADSGGYDDFHKAFRAISTQWPSANFPTFGPPRLRHGRAGGSWRHVKEVLQAGGHRIVFVDGQVRWDDTNLMDSVPGGNLLQPEAQSYDSPRGLMRTHSMNDRHGNQNRTGLRRDKTVNKINASNYGIETKRGLEHNNWCVIR